MKKTFVSFRVNAELQMFRGSVGLTLKTCIDMAENVYVFKYGGRGEQVAGIAKPQLCFKSSHCWKDTSQKTNAGYF